MSDRGIREMIKKMAGLNKVDQVTYVDAEVVSVDTASRTCVCEVTLGETSYVLPDVRLMAAVGDGILIVPKIDSDVKIIFSALNEPFVCQYSDVEKVVIDANTSISFNDGSFGGVLKAAELVADINNIKKDINNLKQAFSSWVVIPNDGGAALKTAATTWFGESIPDTNLSDVVNNKVTHGK